MTPARRNQATPLEAFGFAGRQRTNVRRRPDEEREARGADVVFWPLPASGKPALVVELKYDGSAEGAIEQIKKKQYTQALEGYTGEILLVGINYDKDGGDKAHSCVIERVMRNEEAR